MRNVRAVVIRIGNGRSIQVQDILQVRLEKIIIFISSSESKAFNISPC